MRQHSIRIGHTSVGKSLGSKTILFAQSKFEIAQADRQDMVPSIVTAKHLDFLKAEPITKFKPGVFDDGMLQRMDASFLRAFLNPSVPWQSCLCVCVRASLLVFALAAHATYMCVCVGTKKQHKTTKEEDATVWVRYYSAQFDQGAGRRACNNPYNHVLDCELFQKMETTGKTHIGHKDFLD